MIDFLRLYIISMFFYVGPAPRAQVDLESPTSLISDNSYL